MAATKAILTTAVVYVRDLILAAGGAPAATGRPGITLFTSNAAVTTVAGDLTTLISYTLPANVLARDGDRIEIEASTVQAADADIKTSALTFGATVVAGRTANDNALARNLRATIMRTGAATQISVGTTETHGAGDILTHASPGETLSGTIVVALKGQNTTDTTSPSVTSRQMTVTYFPAP